MYIEDTSDYGEIPCDGTGQDGDWLNDAVIPVPRFMNNNNGTVTDNLTGLVWLQNASCWLNRTWKGALLAANDLSDIHSSNDHGLSDGSKKGEWRLPSLRELQSLINYAHANPAVSNAVGNGKHDTEGDPFLNIHIWNYWPSTTFPADSKNAWFVNFYDGTIGVDSNRSLNYWVWPVRDPK